MHENRMGGLVGVVHGIDYLYLSLAVVLMPGKLGAEGDRKEEPEERKVRLLKQKKKLEQQTTTLIPNITCVSLCP